MSVHFESIRVKSVRKETNDCVSIVLDIPAALQAQYAFQQGQYLTIKTTINGEEVRRSYSLCSSPLDKEWRVAIKKVDGGVFSTYANEVLKAGDTLDVMPPMGKFFTPIQSEQAKQYVCFAAGSGITPILSIIKTVLVAEPLSQVILVYGNRSKASIIFKEQLEALKNKYMERFSLIHVLSREKMDAPIQSGRITADKCAALSSTLIKLDQADAFFICGPEEMTLAVRDYLKAQSVDSKKIHVELFTSAGARAKQHQAPKEQADNAPASKIIVKLDGRSFDFKLPFEGESILDAALKQGADLPFACKGGVCCTCKAKLIEGEVDMDVNYGLEPEEIEQGFILTCQSHPRTEQVVVDYDYR
jgi:ring-1,2-phenylacetyl-CoA epoxidase subunit PaaE